MSDKGTTWSIHTTMNKLNEADGTITLSFSGISSTNGLKAEIYRGQQTTRIEYY